MTHCPFCKKQSMLFHVIDFDMVDGKVEVQPTMKSYGHLVFCINCGIVFVEDVLKQNSEVIPMAKQWIAKATSKNKGKFSASAKKAGMSTSAYAKKVTKKGSKSSTKLKKEANLAKTLRKFHK